jgi:hypothetical protein
MGDEKFKDPDPDAEHCFSPSIISCLPWLAVPCVHTGERTRTNTQEILKSQTSISRDAQPWKA